jgi:hypothetical protein
LLLLLLRLSFFSFPPFFDLPRRSASKTLLALFFDLLLSL